MKSCGWKRFVAALSGALLLSWSLGWSAGGDEAREPVIPQKDLSGLRACDVLRVAAHDTLVVQDGQRGQRVALIGVGALPAGEAAAQDANRFAVNLLKGEQVFVEYETNPPQPDRFGRYPAYVYRCPDGLFVNLELIRQGYAPVDVQATFELQPLFEQLELRAKQAGKGCWAYGGIPTPAEGVTAPPAVVQSPTDQGAVIVYITASGKKYHRAECRHLRKSCIPMDLNEARVRGYEPCSQCKPPK
jgi:endonuclease YncB( thermonuclease family)